MSQAESFIKQKSSDDYVWDLKKNVKLSNIYFKQIHFVMLIKLKANTKTKNIKCLKILEPSNKHRRNLIKKASLFDVRKTWSV